MNNWVHVVNAARNTVNKKEIFNEPSSEWKRKMLISEHSPIRLIKILYTWHEIKRWVSTHFVRHKFGIEHFISTKREDRTGISRDELRQDVLDSHTFEANAQAIINISRKRLCTQAHKETTEKWKEFLSHVKEIEPELYSVCVRECVYRGFCPDITKCGYSKTEEYEKELKKYRNL
jgi:hypothetical protein